MYGIAATASGTMAAVVPMDVPTSQRVNGMMATIKMMNGMERPMLIMTPAIRWMTPVGQNVIRARHHDEDAQRNADQVAEQGRARHHVQRLPQGRPQHLQHLRIKHRRPPPSPAAERPRSSGIVKHLRHRTQLRHPALIEHRHPAAHRPHHVHLVRHHDDGQAQPAVDVFQQVEKRLRRLRVQRRRRLVAQQNAGLGGQRPGDADPLLLAAAQFGRIPVRLLAQSDELSNSRPRRSRSLAGMPTISIGNDTLAKAVRLVSKLKC